MNTCSTSVFAELMNQIEEHNLILQMAISETEKRILVEYLPKEEPHTDAPYKWVSGDMDFENSLDTIINKDPFGAKYSGRAIREIFENGDREWLDIALSKMHNAFIVDKLKYILERGGYGKILC